MEDIGKRYGCGVAVVIAVAPILPLAFVLGWSGAHCDPVPSCQRNAEWRIGLIFIGILLFAGVIGYGLRRLLNVMAAKREGSDHPMTFSGTANALSLVVIVVALALLWLLASF